MNKANKSWLTTSSRGTTLERESGEIAGGPHAFCEGFYLYPQGSLKMSRVSKAYSQDWVGSVPTAIQELADMVSQRQKHQFRINLLEIVVNELKSSVQRLQSLQSKLVAINTFAPEQYEVLKPIVVSVNPVEDGFNACWIDANVHSSGDNEEEAVGNLKSLILDFFDSLSKEPADKLGPEPKRQKIVINEFIIKRAA